MAPATHRHDYGTLPDMAALANAPGDDYGTLPDMAALANAPGDDYGTLPDMAALANAPGDDYGTLPDMTPLNAPTSGYVVPTTAPDEDKSPPEDASEAENAPAAEEPGDPLGGALAAMVAVTPPTAATSTPPTPSPQPAAGQPAAAQPAATLNVDAFQQLRGGLAAQARVKAAEAEQKQAAAKQPGAPRVPKSPQEERMAERIRKRHGDDAVDDPRIAGRLDAAGKVTGWKARTYAYGNAAYANQTVGWDNKKGKVFSTPRDRMIGVDRAKHKIINERIQEYKGEQELSELWKRKRNDLLQSIEQLTTFLKSTTDELAKLRHLPADDPQVVAQLATRHQALEDLDYRNRELVASGLAEDKERKVEYLTAEKRKEFQLNLVGGVTQGPQLLAFDTSKMYSYNKSFGWAAFVMAPSGTIYAAQHQVSTFHHSSFLAGDTVACAGELKVVGGQIRGITNKSGHYRPTKHHMLQFLRELASRNVNLTNITQVECLDNDSLVPLGANAQLALDALEAEANAPAEADTPPVQQPGAPSASY